MRRGFRIPWRRRRRRRSWCAVGFRRLQSDGGCYWAHRSPCHSFSLSPYQNNAFFCYGFLSFNNSAANCFYFFNKKTTCRLTMPFIIRANSYIFGTSFFIQLREELSFKKKYICTISLSLSLHNPDCNSCVNFSCSAIYFWFWFSSFFNQWWKCGSYLEL